MEYSITQIAGKPNDFKYCNVCGHINWYENKNCIGCNKKKFNKMTDEDAKDLLKDFKGEEWTELEV